MFGALPAPEAVREFSPDRSWRSFRIPDPAAGADFRVTVPGGEGWLVQGLLATLTTSAVVATRQPRLTADDQTDTWLMIPAGDSPAASTTTQYTLILGGPTGVTSSPASDVWGGPSLLYLPPGHRFGPVTNNLQAADAWTVIRMAVIVVTIRGALAAAEAELRRRAAEADVYREAARHPAAYFVPQP